MKNSKILALVTFFVILLVGMSACSKTSDQTTSAKKQSEPESISESTDDSSQSNHLSTDSTMKSDKNDDNSSDKASIDNNKSQEEANPPSKSNKNIQEEVTTKIVGRRKEFIERLDNIQKGLDALPYKKDSDNGVTNAMKNYYGVSYDRYDKALNEIYTLLQSELSPKIMKALKNEEINWIKQKEDIANEERLKYKGKTFEWVAYYISSYKSTKERCYQLVNTYMTD